MSAYVLSVIGTVLLCAILNAVLPTGKTSGVIKGVARMACVVSIVMPILIFFQSGEWSIGKTFFEKDFAESVIQTDEEFIEYYSQMRVREAQLSLQKDLKSEFLVEADVQIEWTSETEEYGKIYNEDKIKIVRIVVKNKEKQSEEVENAMWEYLTQNYCSEVLIE
jgi:hypothetical protein